MSNYTPDVCTRCGSLDLKPRKTTKYAKLCHPCHRNKQRERRAANPAYGREWARERLTGWSAAAYSRQKVIQEGKCAICKRHETVFKNSLHADHCHKTGRTRGLLCSSCNRGLGLFRDSIPDLIQAIHYLTLYKD